MELIRNKTGVIGADKNTRTENKNVVSKSPEKNSSEQQNSSVFYSSTIDSIRKLFKKFSAWIDK